MPNRTARRSHISIGKTTDRPRTQPLVRSRLCHEPRDNQYLGLSLRRRPRGGAPRGAAPPGFPTASTV